MKKEMQNHELDLALIHEFGFMPNNEERLFDKQFLTDQKVEKFGNVFNTILNNDDSKISPSVSK